MKLTLRAFGSSTGVILPMEALRRMKVKRGDLLFAVETLDGLFLTPHRSGLPVQLKLGREIMREHRTLRVLPN
jgi:antitoxin component of MazEF toxin-antitoxin module